MNKIMMMKALNLFRGKLLSPRLLKNSANLVVIFQLIPNKVKKKACNSMSAKISNSNGVAGFVF